MRSAVFYFSFKEKETLTMSVLSAENISFSYSRKPVLDGVSFAIEEAERVAVIGPNGSGKTTLLKIINGTLFPDSGKMFVDGRETVRWSRKAMARRVAIVPQETAVTFPFYAEEIVLMGRFPHLSKYRFEDKKDYQIVQAAMDRTDTRAFAARRFDELSAGERQRVLIARALAQEPDVLLLDESTVFLDLKHQARFLSLLKQLNTVRKLTVIFVTHDINLAAQNADKIILLDCGKIYAIGNPADVITAANIKEVYDVDIVVDRNPHDGSPRSILLTT